MIQVNRFILVDLMIELSRQSLKMDS